MTVNSRSSGEEFHNISLGDDGPSWSSDRTKFRHRYTVSRDDETLARNDGVDHFGVVISKFTLCDDLGHGLSVANSATLSYVVS
jgi:hypothetical protein